MSPKKLRKVPIAELVALQKPKPAAPGKDGVSFVGAEIVDGNLHVSNSKGETADLGQIIFKPKDGQPGASFTGATIENDHIIFTLDGKKVDAGRVVYPPEPARRGKPGHKGVGITGGQVGPDGHLVFKLTDGTREDVGNVLIKPENGKDGVGVKKMFIDSKGHLIIKFSSGPNQDAGLVREKAAAAAPVKVPKPGKDAPRLVKTDQKGAKFWLVLDDDTRLGPITLPEVHRISGAGLAGGGSKRASTGPIKYNSRLETSDYSVSDKDVVVVAEAIGSPVLVTLPAASDGRVLEMYSKYSSDSDVKLVGTINGDANGFTLQPSESLFLRGVDNGAGGFEWIS